jgi:uncharacterized protein (DUF58 family)
MKARAHTTLDALVRMEHLAKGITFLPKQPLQSLLSGRHASRLRGRGLTFEELRHYRPGDDIRSMDWKATARLRKPHVRVYSEERDRPTMMLIDQRSTMFFGSVAATKSVIAAEAAALVAWSVLNAGDRVGAVILGDAECIEIKPHRSRRNVLRILGEITRLNQTLPGPVNVRDPEAIHHALRRIRHFVPHDALVVALSDYYGLDAEGARLTTEIARHNDVLAVLVYDPLEGNLPVGPDMIATDGEVQMEVPDSARFSRDYHSGAGERINQLRKLLRRLRIPIVPLGTADPVVDQLNELFGRHATPPQ